MSGLTRTLIIVFLSLRASTLLLSPAQIELDAWGAKSRQVEQHLEQTRVG